MRRFSVLIVAGALLWSGVPATKTNAAIPAPFRAYEAGMGSSAHFFRTRGEGHGKKASHDAADDYDDDGEEDFYGDREERLRERLERLPPEQREEARRRIEDIAQKRRALQAELEDLPPEERKARMEELRSEWGENKRKRHESFRQKFSERWNDATDEERRSFCLNARERCAQDGTHNACETVEENCSSY